MTVELFVILPDGTIDLDAAKYLVAYKGPIVPLHGEVDILDVLRPEFAKYQASYLRQYTPEGINYTLDRRMGERIVVERSVSSRKYGNQTGRDLGDYDTLRDAIRDGIVVTVDGLPWYPVVSRNGSIQSKYREMRRNGESHNMAAMLAARKFPGVKTDSVFNEGKFSGQGQGDCDPHHAWNLQQAKNAGVSTNGKWYCSGLASFPGDPTAWVDSRGDVIRIAKEKNMTTHGYVEYQGHETDPGEDVRIADDIIDDEVNDILDSNPGANAEYVREQLVDLRTGRVDPNPLLCRDYTSTDIG